MLRILLLIFVGCGLLAGLTKSEGSLQGSLPAASGWVLEVCHQGCPYPTIASAFQAIEQAFEAGSSARFLIPAILIQPGIYQESVIFPANPELQATAVLIRGTGDGVIWQTAFPQITDNRPALRLRVGSRFGGSWVRMENLTFQGFTLDQALNPSLRYTALEITTWLQDSKATQSTIEMDRVIFRNWHAALAIWEGTQLQLIDSFFENTHLYDPLPPVAEESTEQQGISWWLQGNHFNRVNIINLEAAILEGNEFINSSLLLMQGGTLQRNRFQESLISGRAISLIENQFDGSLLIMGAGGTFLVQDNIFRKSRGTLLSCLAVEGPSTGITRTNTFEDCATGLSINGRVRLTISSNTFVRSGCGVQVHMAQGVDLKEIYRINGVENEFRENQQDLCPPDFPWPPDFVKR